jgi:hypothetical protein
MPQNATACEQGASLKTYDPKFLRDFYAYYITRIKEVASKGSGGATFTLLSYFDLCSHHHSSARRITLTLTRMVRCYV